MTFFINESCSKPIIIKRGAVAKIHFPIPGKEFAPQSTVLHVCSDHFKHTDFDPDPKLILKILKPGVVPTIFSQKNSDLKVQTTVHEGQKNYKCDICSKFHVNPSQRTEGRLNLNFQAHPYGVAFLNL